ncbi:MAG: ABC transporter substrate-binding protein [Acidobacteriota bacterium]
MTIRVPLQFGVLPLAAAALVIACGGADAPDDGTGPIKIGAIFDYTGPTSDVGTLYAEGIRDYVDWVNQNGGIEGREVDLLYQDYGYKVDQAEQLYSQFVQEGAVAFMGWGTGDTEALKGRIAEDHIPFMSASYSHVLGDPAEAPFNFLSGATYTDQFKVLIDWIVEREEGGAPAIALMHNPSPFGLSPYEQGGKDYAAEKGIELTAHEMPRGSTDYTAELTRIAEQGAKYVVFQNTSSPVSVALRNASDLSLDMTFACLNWCTNGVLTGLAGDAANGVIGAVSFAPPGDGVEGLGDADAYLQGKGSSIAEKGLLYGQGWWTMGIMMEGVRRAAAQGDVTGDTVKAALETLSGFETGGVTSPITYTATDHRGIKGLRLFEVQDSAWNPVTEIRQADS